MYSWIKGEKQELIFILLEKHLFRQKVLIACALNPTVTKALNGASFRTENKGTPLERLSRCMASPKTVAETGSMKRGGSQAAQDIGAAGCSDLFTGKAHWSDMRMGISQPESVYDSESFWIEFLFGMENLLRNSCDVDSRHTLYQKEGQKNTCFNCSTNVRMRNHCEYDVAPENRQVKEMMWMATLAARLQVTYEDRYAWKHVNPQTDTLGFMVQRFSPVTCKLHANYIIYSFIIICLRTCLCHALPSHSP